MQQEKVLIKDEKFKEEGSKDYICKTYASIEVIEPKFGMNKDC